MRSFRVDVGFYTAETSVLDGSAASLDLWSLAWMLSENGQPLLLTVEQSIVEEPGTTQAGNE